MLLVAQLVSEECLCRNVLFRFIFGTITSRTAMGGLGLRRVQGSEGRALRAIVPLPEESLDPMSPNQSGP